MNNFAENIIFTGIQPSGRLTLGNYLGTMKYWKNFQKSSKCYFCIADLHVLTTSLKDRTYFLKRTILDTLSWYLACGIDYKKNIIFVQSHVPAHSQLYWILNCISYYGELSRMTQFKNQVFFKKKNINLGLFGYPVLMASDILLYQSNLILVGQDQKQHLEFTQKIAKRLNSIYGNIFIIPQIFIPIFGKKIMGLQNPLKKMSKTDKNQKNVIFLEDPVKISISKIQLSITDSDNPPRIIYDPQKKPGISNLLIIGSLLSDQKIEILEKKFLNKTYQQFKDWVSIVLKNFLKKIQNLYLYYRKDELKLYQILKNGSKIANNNAQNFLHKIQKKMNI
ncbi:tryptophan--tRNA ligase [Buchnera aphidicola]|uniref:tryptophan--tRNA ligase n=1 Tax=Buchnera aphidicola TaxID=9 RepID=UPI0031B880A3